MSLIEGDSSLSLKDTTKGDGVERHELLSSTTLGVEVRINRKEHPKETVNLNKDDLRLTTDFHNDVVEYV